MIGIFIVFSDFTKHIGKKISLHFRAIDDRPYKSMEDNWLFCSVSKNKVIANQPEGWCGDLPVFAGNPGFLTKKCRFLWGIATPLRPQARTERNRRRRLLARSSVITGSQ